MSKKQARQKKLADVEAATAASPLPRKPLIITPQIAVSLQGEYPYQALIVEQPNHSGSRKKVELTKDNAHQVLWDILTEKAAEIELERAMIAERRSRAPRRKAQPDWRTIAVHPEATIIERLATRSPQLASNKADLSLEDMGL